MEAAEVSAEPVAPPAEDIERLGTKWMERIHAAKTREKDFCDDAEAAEKAYACDTSATKGTIYDFNLHFSNVETIVPAIYNSTPVPDIRRRFVEAIGEEPQPPAPPQMAGPRGPMPGAPQPGMPPQIPANAMPPRPGMGAMPGPQMPAPAAPPNPMMAMQALLQQQAAMQAIEEWKRKKQADKDAKDFGDMLERAIAGQIDDNRLDKEIEQSATDAFNAGRGLCRIRLFVEDDMGQPRERLGYEAVSWRDFRMGPAARWEHVGWIAFRHTMSRENVEQFTDEELASKGWPAIPTSDQGDDDDICIWEVWDKSKRRVIFIREHDSRIIKIEDDPLRLKDFFPMGEPVQPIRLTGKMTPVVPFSIYRKLLDEIDTTTKRITKIIKGMKVRGAFIGGGGDIASVSQADDWEVVPLTDMEQLSQVGGGFEKAISWWPIEQAIKVVIQLSDHREKVKQQIFELTGISDIIRGQSKATETARAQEIKTQWGALRIQKMQKLIERQVRDLFCLSAEVICTHFSEETLHAMTGIRMTDGMRALMQRPVYAAYRIDVESDSTVRADMTRAKGEMAEFLNGTANFFRTVGPLAKEQPQIAEPMAEVYASFARVFRLGKQAEDAVERMAEMARKAAKQRQSDPQNEIEKQRLMQEAKDAQAKVQIELENLKLTNKKLDAEAQIAAVTLKIKQEELELKKRQQVIDTIHDEQEIQIERSQARPVAIGQM